MPCGTAIHLDYTHVRDRVLPGCLSHLVDCIAILLPDCCFIRRVDVDLQYACVCVIVCFSHSSIPLSHAVNCVRFCFGAVCGFFACESNISRTAKRICAKFTGKTCLVPRSEEFECQGQGSKVKVTRDKNALRTIITLPAATEWSVLLHDTL